MKKPILLTLLSACLLGMGLTAVTKAQAQSKGNTETVILAGYKLNPSVPTSASGTITLRLKADTLTVEGTFSDLMAPYVSAAIYYAKKDLAVNQIFRLKSQINEERTGGSFRAEDNQFKLSEAHMELLRNGELSIRISSNQHKQGEIGAWLPTDL
ncbi:CHRD domain-containing protein [Halalkalibaculum sp. DA3122]|uniref:CHRD domain-containing protein n=1 Tax=unclassified Halalkalibaculum TaxID=2964617 RepID=UPI0037548DB9